MAELYAFIKLLPELMGLVKALQLAIEKAEADRKVKNDLKAISEAFASGDQSKLAHLFSDPS